MRLDATQVETTFKTCFSLEGSIKVEGIHNTALFDANKLERHREEITALLAELPDSFQHSKGGGMSFLNACDDKHGRQWTGLHVTMERLFMLGIGIGKVEFCLPRDLWSALPGGMPYIVVLDKPK